ncbi:fructoselysine 6-kinase [Clostridium manihotivorum]|uniref:Carbohydrate kinase n=1 Tax=Clostridium manihotivorum TaxID=2320868 RepID=A0A3R5QZZ4_9CLOT|nr:fructoselysine 6-kinase [Clostridium manihotivorum]QAA33442.1 carbohydrate kinase [Clostridium manihotivorum]
MKVAVIGDNCIDYYKRLNRLYPTGNVVDTGVNLRKLGINTSIISTTGSDDYGQLMIDTLEKEGLDISHLKVAIGKTAITYMDMDGLERIHGEYDEGVLENIFFDEEDIDFAATHNLVHSAFWGKADGVLEEIKRKGALVSFDYATGFDKEIVDRTVPFVDYGFFSFVEKDDYVRNFLKEKVEKGLKIAVATFGEKGSLAYDGQDYYEFGVFKAKVVNTVGAGDAFIAGFLYSILNNEPVEKALEQGAKIAAKVIEVFEPWVTEIN